MLHHVDDRFRLAHHRRYVAKLDEARKHIPPMFVADKKDPDDQTKSKHREDLGRHDPLQCVIDLATDQHWQGHTQ